MKYFGWPPDFINTMTWSNLILYMASIPQYNNDQKKTKLEVKNASDIF